jgi:hypothetical protein
MAIRWGGGGVGMFTERREGRMRIAVCRHLMSYPLFSLASSRRIFVRWDILRERREDRMRIAVCERLMSYPLFSLASIR